MTMTEKTMKTDDLSDFHGRPQPGGAETDGVEAVDGIPVRWVAPDTPQGVALWLTHLGGSAKQTAPMLARLGERELLAASFDEHFGVASPRVAGGVSTGGDVAVALAGVDPRIDRVAALVATPDWARPGMQTLGEDLAPVRSPWRS
jgi:hypothetical protein